MYRFESVSVKWSICLLMWYIINNWSNIFVCFYNVYGECEFFETHFWIRNRFIGNGYVVKCYPKNRFAVKTRKTSIFNNFKKQDFFFHIKKNVSNGAIMRLLKTLVYLYILLLNQQLLNIQENEAQFYDLFTGDLLIDK